MCTLVGAVWWEDRLLSSIVGQELVVAPFVMLKFVYWMVVGGLLSACGGPSEGEVYQDAANGRRCVVTQVADFNEVRSVWMRCQNHKCSSVLSDNERMSIDLLDRRFYRIEKFEDLCR